MKNNNASFKEKMKDDKLISAYAVPGVRDVVVFKNYRMEAVRVKDAFVSIDTKWKQVRFSKKLVSEIGLVAGSRIIFLILDGAIYFASSPDGNVLIKKIEGYMALKSYKLIHHLRDSFGIKNTIKCVVKKTKSEFGGNQLFEVVLPNKYYLRMYRHRNKKELS